MKNISLGLLLLFSATLASKSQRVIRIPLHYSVGAIEQRWGSKELTEEDLSHAPLMLYYGLIELGEPGQSFKAAFQTSVGNVFVPSKDCTIPFCNQRNKYYSNQSTAYVENGAQVELSRDYIAFDGFLSTDTLTIAGLTVADQTFVEITDGNPADRLRSFPFDAVVGLAFPDRSVNGVPTMFQNMYDQSLVDENKFSLWFNRSAEAGAEHGGLLILGGTDDNLYTSPVTYLNITGGGLWEVNMDRVDIVNKYLGCANGCTAVLDSGRHFITGPGEEIRALNEALGAELIIGTPSYSISCGNIRDLPIVHMRLGGNDFQLRGRDYVREVENSNGTECVTEFFDIGLTNSSKYILGGTFLSHYYVEFDFDQRRVGFARGVRG